MILFINNKRIKFIHQSKSLKNSSYSNFLNLSDNIIGEKLVGKILVYKSDIESIISFLKLLETPNFEHIQAVHFIVDDVEKAENRLKKEYKIIKAAGGIVLKNMDLLMIYRLGNWDFPKGKLEADEKSNVAATREVFEECGVKAEISSKICSTWHTYTDKDKKILKKTTWYLMDCWDDTELKPQIEEGIEKIEWVSLEDAQIKLKNSFLSLKYVLKKYRKGIKYD